MTDPTTEQPEVTESIETAGFYTLSTVVDVAADDTKIAAAIVGAGALATANAPGSFFVMDAPIRRPDPWGPPELVAQSRRLRAAKPQPYGVSVDAARAMSDSQRRVFVGLVGLILLAAAIGVFAIIHLS